MLCLRRPAGIEKALLGKQHERLFRAPVFADRLLGRNDFLDRSSKMQRSGTSAFLCSPRNWRIQCPIHFENAGTILILLKFPPIAWWKFIAGKPQDLFGREIQQYRARRRQFAQGSYVRSRHDASTKRSQI